MKRFIYIFLISSVFIFCKGKEKINKGIAASKDTVLLASIETTPCYGMCPVFKISVYDNGYVLYDGRQHVPDSGFHYSNLDKAAIEQIKAYITEKNLYSLQNEYTDSTIADFPTTFIEINLNGKYKLISNTHPEAPENLTAFGKLLMSFFPEETLWKPLK